MCSVTKSGPNAFETFYDEWLGESGVNVQISKHFAQPCFRLWADFSGNPSVRECNKFSWTKATKNLWCRLSQLLKMFFTRQNFYCFLTRSSLAAPHSNGGCKAFFGSETFWGHPVAAVAAQAPFSSLWSDLGHGLSKEFDRAQNHNSWSHSTLDSLKFVMVQTR